MSDPVTYDFTDDETGKKYRIEGDADTSQAEAMDFLGTLDDNQLKEYEIPSTPADEGRGFVDRAVDSYTDAARSGMGWLARRGQYYTGTWHDKMRQRFPDATDEEIDVMTWNFIKDTDREDQMEREQRQESDPAWRQDQSILENLTAFDRWLPTVGGALTGSASPIDVFAPGSGSVVRQAGQAAGLNAIENVATQGVDINDGIQDEFSEAETLMAAGLGAGLQGITGSISKGLKNRTDPEVEVARDYDLESELISEIDRGSTYEEIADRFPELGSYIDNAETNVRRWVNYRAAGGTSPVTFNVEGKMTDLLKRAESAKVSQQQLNAANRRSQFERLREANRNTTGQDRVKAQRAALKGEADKVSFEPIEAEFTQVELDSLFDQVNDNPNLSPWEAVSASEGLTRLLNGQPARPGELDKLNRVFGEQFIKAASSKRGPTSAVKDALVNGLNMPRSLMSSFDLSAPGRQGLVLITRPEWWTSWNSMFKSLGSERAARELDLEIQSRDTYDLMQDSGLSLTRSDGKVFDEREEAFMSQWADEVPGVAASQRAFVSYLNKLRADTFDSMVRNIEKTGVDVRSDPEMVEGIAKYINSATGRGDIGGTLGQAGPILNATFFSPKLIKSRVDLLNPVYYAGLPKEVRLRAVRDMVALGTVATTAMTIAAGSGYDVETDPRSSDFGKLRDGTTRYDILGGFGQYLTLAARVATQSTKTVKGDEHDLRGGLTDSLVEGDDSEPKGPYSQSTGDVVTKFARNKTSPIASYVIDYMQGENTIGEDFYAPRDAMERMMPLFISDIQEIIQRDQSLENIGEAAPALFGVGYSDFDSVPGEEEENK